MNRDCSSVPVINVDPLFSDDRTVWDAVDSAIGGALEHFGAFMAAGLPNPLRPDEAQTAKLLAFYDLPQPLRDEVGTRQVRPSSERSYRGYSATLRNGWAHNEIYDIGPETPVTGPPIKDIETLIESNAWPTQEPAPDWRTEMITYYQHMHHFSELLIRSIARYLGVNETAAAARFEGSNSTLRLLNYPPIPSGIVIADEPDAVRVHNGVKQRLMAMEHKDQCCLSMLWQDQSGGLQIQTPDEIWLAVPKVSDGVSVHLGMAIETMSAGRLSGTLHRVLGQGNARQSIGFFFEPNLFGSLKAFTTAATEEPAAPEDTYAAALLNTIAERVARRKRKEQQENTA